MPNVIIKNGVNICAPPCNPAQPGILGVQATLCPGQISLPSNIPNYVWVSNSNVKSLIGLYGNNEDIVFSKVYSIMSNNSLCFSFNTGDPLLTIPANNVVVIYNDVVNEYTDCNNCVNPPVFNSEGNLNVFGDAHIYFSNSLTTSINDSPLNIDDNGSFEIFVPI